MLVTFENVAFGYGDNLIFSGADFAISEGERVGLIGSNGEGKTTLIKLIVGDLLPDSGNIFIKNGSKFGYLEQNGGYSSGNSVYEEMKEVFKEDAAAIERLSELSAQLSVLPYGEREYNAVSAKIESIQKFIYSRDSYNVDVKIKTVLNGMGFADFYEQIIDTMSGGEKTRLKLCRLLLEQPDLLILDEPTNHLDIPTLYWLEDYLQTYKGAVLVVSHDRYFLDKICLRTLELENKKLSSFSGNYSKYKVLKAEKLAREIKEYEAQQEERAKLQDYVDRNIVRATTAKSALSRVKQLERMDILEKPYIPPKPPAFRFEYDERPYEKVLTVTGIDLEIGGKRLISSGYMQILRGEKVALVGQNGTGKSTLLKEIISGGNPNIERGRFVRLALFDQEGLNLNGDNTVLAELWERHVGATQTEIRSALARAGLFEEDMQKSVKSLSGGERAKLALCVLESERANVLLLDEPTNHLDLPARESLEKALKDFDGTLLFVSHDRYFISALADKVEEIEDGKLNTYAGNYAYYNEQKSKQREAAARIEAAAQFAERERERNASYRSKKERAEDARKKEAIKRAEEGISKLEGEEEELNALLSDPLIAADYKRVVELMERLAAIKLQLDALYDEYGKML